MDPPPIADQLLRQSRWTRRLARGLLGDESAAEDTLQETWEAIRRNPPSADRPVEPWLRRTIRNRLLNRARDSRRRNAREQEAVPEGGPESPEEAMARLQLHGKLVEAVTRLPEPYRQTLLLRYFEEQTSAQIGERLHLPAATVRGRLKTAIELLREELDRGSGGRVAWMGVVAGLAGLPQPTGTQAAVGKVGWHVAGRPLAGKVLLGVGVAALVTVAGTKLARMSSPPVPPLVAETRRLPATPPRFEGARGEDRRDQPPPRPAAPADPLMAAVVPPKSGPTPPAGRATKSVTGRVWLAGQPPPRAPLDMSGDPHCARQPKAEDETILADQGGWLANAVVRVVVGLPPQEPPPADRHVVVEARRCVYRPRVVVARAGQTVEFRNADEATHTPHVWSGDGREVVRPVARGDRPLEVTAPRNGQVLRVKCDQHPWMAATVLATGNDFFAITDQEGRYALPPLPPGGYLVEVWHESFPPKQQEVTVGAGAAIADFVLGGEYRPAVSGGTCALALKGEGPVARACRQGGIKLAKATMKGMLRKGKAKGLKFECDDCHKDEAAGDWRLNKDAEEKFKKLLAAQ